MATLLALALGARSAPAQRLEIAPERDSATVGDVVALSVRWFPHPQDTKLSPAPVPPDPLPDGFQVIQEDSLVRSPDGTWRGKIYVAFYRTGTRTVPPFGLPFRRGADVLTAALRSEPAAVEIVPTLTGGNPSLRDIRELAPGARRPWLAIAVGALGLGLLGVIARRLGRRARPAPAAPPDPPSPPRADPYERARARLARFEVDGQDLLEPVDRHYEEVLDILRDYLTETGALPARSRTSSELLRGLPAALRGNGLEQRIGRLLVEADLVKFARLRPDRAAARAFTAGAREVLEAWHRSSGEVAVRESREAPPDSGSAQR